MSLCLQPILANRRCENINLTLALSAGILHLFVLRSKLMNNLAEMVILNFPRERMVTQSNGIAQKSKLPR